MSDLFREALLLRHRVELEQLITEREGMIAANWLALSTGCPPPHAQAAFDELATRIAYCAPDPHNFS